MDMDRGLRALSPNEESTLIQVSRAGVLKDEYSQAREVRQLVALRLIELSKGAWRLTTIGEARVKSLPNRQ